MFDILRQARELVAACRITEPPVALGKLARRQDIREIRIEDSVLNGELRRLKSGGFMVRLDGRDSEARRRFTLAHEIAHTLLIARNKSDSAIKCADEDVENLCDLAAAELLIPEVLLRREHLKLDLESILLLSGTFKCSLEAAAWKLLNMHDWKGALLFWRINRTDGVLTARIVAMPRTLSLTLPFKSGMVISESDINWSAVACSNRRLVVLQTRDREVSYSAQRRTLGKSSVVTLIRLSKMSEAERHLNRQLNKQNDLFFGSNQGEGQPSKRIVEGGTT